MAKAKRINSGNIIELEDLPEEIGILVMMYKQQTRER